LPEVDVYKMTRRYNKGYTGIEPQYENPWGSWDFYS
jgi:hypothetical protein